MQPPSTPEPFCILVADDHGWVRDLIAHVISGVLPSAKIIGVADGQRALEAFETEGCDLLVTDQQMPALDGLALIRAVRAQAPLLPILMVSIHPGIEFEAMAAGATGYLPKHRVMEYLPAFLLRFAEGSMSEPSSEPP